MKRHIVILLVAGVLLALLITPSSLAQKKLKGKVSIWGGYYLNTLTEYCMNAGFLKHHPEVKIEYSSYPYYDYPTKMKMALGANDQDPDIMTIHSHWIADFYAHGHLLELTDRIGERKHDYLSWMWEPVLDSKGRIWGLPFDASCNGFIYRKDIYDRYGLSVPKTREEFIDIGQKLRGIGKYISMYYPAGGDYARAWQIGGTSGLNVFNSEGEVILDAPEGRGIYVAKLVKDLVDTGIFWTAAGINSPESFTAREEGEVASFLGNTFSAPWLRNNISDKSEGYGMWRFALPPQMVDDPVADLTTRHTEYLAISNWSDNKDLAWEIIDWYEGSIEGAKLPSLKDATMTPYLPALRELAEEETPKWPLFNQSLTSEYAKILLTYSVHLPTSHPALYEGLMLFQEELANMFAGEKTPEEAVKAAADRLRKKLAR